MPINLGFSPDGLTPEVTREFDHLVSKISAWADRQEGVGSWILLPYTRATYGQNLGLWTVAEGNHRYYAYSVVGGSTMHINIWLKGTITSAAIDHELHIYLPDGWGVDLPGPGSVGSVDWYDNTGAAGGTGTVFINWIDNVAVSNRRMTLQRNIIGTSWPASNDLVVFVRATVPVRKSL